MSDYKLNLTAIMFLILSLPACNLPQPVEAPPSTATPAPESTTEPTQPLLIPPTVPIDVPTEKIETATQQSDLMTISQLEPGQAVTITYIAMFTSTSGWAIGGLDRSADHILLTQDGGSTWFDHTPPVSLPYEFYPSSAYGFFLDLEHAWISYGGSSDVWFTADGGQTWQSSPSGYPYARQDRIFFSDPDHGWLLRSVESGMGNEYVALFRTDDGGVHWEQLIDPYEDEALQSCLKTGMAFSGTETGWVTYDCQGTYPEPFIDRTLDGGKTWSTILLPLLDDASIMAIGDYCSTISPHLFSAGHGALIVQCVSLEGDEKIVNHTLYLTRDGGTSWEQVTFPGEDILFLDDQKIFALGRELYFSSSAGQSWRKVKILAWDGQFSFVDDKLGWAVATVEDEIALVYTTDGGTKWTELKPTIALP